MRAHGRTQAGFTLIEVMIVVVIIGILASIGLPAYNDYVLRGNRTVARTVILKIASQQENYFTDRKQYATTLNTLSTDYAGSTIWVRKDGRVQSASSTDAIYSVTLTGATTAAFTIAATPINQQAKDTKCGTLSYASTGTTSASGTSAADCWTR